jgi:hypothetical protein
VRAERGNAISKENPNLVAGAAGGGGSAMFAGPGPELCDPVFRPLLPADFVSVPIANCVTAGRSQARRVPETALLDLIGRIIRLRKITATNLLWGRLRHGKTM